jgi:hypothetical protein
MADVCPSPERLGRILKTGDTFVVACTDLKNSGIDAGVRERDQLAVSACARAFAEALGWQKGNDELGEATTSGRVPYRALLELQSAFDNLLSYWGLHRWIRQWDRPPVLADAIEWSDVGDVESRPFGWDDQTETLVGQIAGALDVLRQHLVPAEPPAPQIPALATKRKPIPMGDLNARVREHLENNPDATSRNISKTLVGDERIASRVIQTEAWQAQQAKKKEKLRGRTSKSDSPTSKMLAALRDADRNPSVTVEVLEIIERTYLENAHAEERSRYHSMTQNERFDHLLLIIDQSENG